MKKTKISELPIVPEEHGLDIYERIDFSASDSLMSDAERRFINGLIQYYEPDGMLEVGVHLGGGSVNLLNAMSETALLVSIDYEASSFIGKTIFDNYPELITDRWNLVTGKDPSQVLDDINIKFDFIVIDSFHFHPCEAFNFISILPFLNKGAIVVVHDTFVPNLKALHRHEYYFAPRLLISSVCAEKITIEPNQAGFPNIIAFQVSEDTHKYIRNVFDLLMFPWQYFDTKVVDSMRILINKYYPTNLQSIFESAALVNSKPRGIDLTNVAYTADSPEWFKYKLLTWEQFLELDSDTVFYGAGLNCIELIKLCNDKAIDFGFQIWDMDADSIKEVLGKSVSLPNFETRARPNQKLIITITDVRIADLVVDRFEALGYTVYRSYTLFYK